MYLVVKKLKPKFRFLYDIKPAKHVFCTGPQLINFRQLFSATFRLLDTAKQNFGKTTPIILPTLSNPQFFLLV